MSQPLSPDAPIRLAITVDDLFQWTGIPHPDGYTPRSVTDSLVQAFADHGVPDVYAFSSTAPTEDDARQLASVLDAWCEAGHHVGNHTHHHASLNWVTPETYIADIERSAALLEPWLAQAPTRTFRYAFDMWGDTAEKTRAVQAHLAAEGYRPAPLTYWFYDAQFMTPYVRTLLTGDEAARAKLQDTMVATAVEQLEAHTTAARAAIGRDPVHIGLLHGTAVIGDTVDRILAALVERGVEFVSLDEALTDPFNTIEPPLTTRQFRNATQRWAEHRDVPMNRTPPAALAEIHDLAPIEGMSDEDVLGPAFVRIADALGAVPNPGDFDW